MNLNLTNLIRKLEVQLKNTEKFAHKYDVQANALRNKLTNIANIVSKTIAAQITTKGKKISFWKRGASLSATGRARIIAAQRKRWAKYRLRHGKKNSSSKKKRGQLSTEGRAKIIAAQRKRWATFRKNQG